jgi:hypothetical protein
MSKTVIEIANLILKKSKKNFSQEEMNSFLISTSHMDTNWTYTQKAWHLINGLFVPLCKTCKKNNCKFLSTDYWNWCSNKCMGIDPNVLAKKQQTNIKKFGTKNPQSLLSIRQKQQQTLIEKYGVDNFAKSDLFIEKSTKTFNKKYGVNNPSKSEFVKSKIRQKAKIRNYENVLEKRKATNQKKYNREHVKHSHIDPENIKKLNDMDFLVDQHSFHKKSCKQIAKELGCSSTPILGRFAKAGIKPYRHSNSTPQIELSEFLKTLTPTVELSTRNLIPPFEIDIFLPEQKYAIEMNGVYWHSESRGKNSQYHVNKTLMCEQKGIQLIHMFDIEWLEKNAIVKSKISNQLKKNIAIFARKCIIKEIFTSESRKFLDENHLQGYCNSKIKLGLFFDDQLVSVMTFDKSRFTKKYEWEMVRFCTKIGYHVVGGASRLFTHFVKNYNPQTVISYADLRWSNGNLYEKLNFVFSHNSKPNYWYFHKNNPAQLENRIKYQKHKLKNMFENFDTSKTEWEIMKENNYDRVWDCGNKVYIWKK